ncbi:hypothetical protein PVL29_026152 [Vitis rotundifolia]|uniref:RING-type E3 ubiquitin transferase n=1 Tax=Vitis rotundifolia TaxID=103349 RepID=A0AA39D5L7_VITRO|nr:hypothetical protein PVL29_026152 [Vitis rotundifolia]
MDRYLCLFLFLFVTLFVEMGGGRDECMPHHCGYPGFELSCSENNKTMLDLPVSVKLLVKKIAYKSQEIIVQDPDNCLARQLRNLNLAASPFHFKFEWDFTFFTCSSDKIELSRFLSIPCLSIPGNLLVIIGKYCVFYAVYSSGPVQYTDLSSCRRLYNWSKSICGSCTRGGKICRLKKSNSTEPENECIKVKGYECGAKILDGIYILKLLLDEFLAKVIYCFSCISPQNIELN